VSHDGVPLDVLERVLHFAPHFITPPGKRRG
jgi:hypothetical protein